MSETFTFYLIDSNEKTAIKKIEDILNKYKKLFDQSWLIMMSMKLNLDTNNIGMVGFDVSGGAGDIQTVSCVFFNSSGPDKSKYRFFRVPIKNSESDLEALLFGIKKYLKNNFEVNLILIDGGKTHLNYIKKKFKKIVKELISVSPLAQRTIKSVLNATQNATLHTSIDLEGEAYGRLRSSNDFKEGVESFSEKRPPSYKGN